MFPWREVHTIYTSALFIADAVHFYMMQTNQIFQALNYCPLGISLHHSQYIVLHQTVLQIMIRISCVSEVS